MGGILKGIVVGLACFGLGFAALSVLLPPEENSLQSAQSDPLSQETDRSADPGVVNDPSQQEPDPLPEPEPEPERALEPALEAPVAQEDQEPTVDDVATDAPAVEEPASDAPGGQGEQDSLEAVTEAPSAPASEEPAEAHPATTDAVQAEDPISEPIAQSPAEVDASLADEEATPVAEEDATEATPPAEEDATAQPLPDLQVAPTEADETVPPATVPVLRAVPPAPGLPRTIEGVTVGRLPSIGDDAPPEDDAEPSGSDDTQDLTQPAYQRHGAAYEPGVGPLFSVILLDAPADAAAEAALLALPFAVTIALDPGDPDATRRAAAYRDAGHEIVILAAGLPQGATPSDLEVTFDGWFRALPETVALLDVPEGGFQANRALAQQIMPFLQADGHGLITQERGLNPAQQSARSAGVASASVFRIIDSDDENQFTIRRYLDRATFRAQQEGRVVVMGRAAHPETIAGLIGWRMEGRAGQVTIAPVSAQLARP